MEERRGQAAPAKKAFYEGPEKATPDFLVGAGLALLSIYVLISSYRMPHFSGSGWLGSPGLTPGLIALVLLILSIALMVRARDFRLKVGPFSPRIETIRAASCFAMIFVYILVTPWIGYVPATFLLLFAFQTAFARKLSLTYVLLWSIGLSAVLTAGLWYVFGQVFFVPLP